MLTFSRLILLFMLCLFINKLVFASSVLIEYPLSVNVDYNQKKQRVSISNEVVNNIKKAKIDNENPFDIYLNIFGESVIFSIKNASFIGKDVFTFSGESKGYVKGNISVSKSGDSIQGVLYYNGTRYVISTDSSLNSSAVYFLIKDVEEDDTPIPTHHKDEKTSISTGGVFGNYKNSPSVYGSSSKILKEVSEIDVLFAYTSLAEKFIGSEDDIKAKAGLYIEESNLSFKQSNINANLNMVGLRKVDFIENQNKEITLRSDLDFLSGKNDGEMDDIHHIRDDVNADVVALLVYNKDVACGISNIRASEDSAFFIVNVNHSCRYTFAHEFGHVVGALHNKEAGYENSPRYNHGYFDNTFKFGTIMARVDNGFGYCPKGSGCQRINYWSNPSLSYQGRPIGFSGTSDNVRFMNLNLARVAKFRDPVGKVTNLSPSGTLENTLDVNLQWKPVEKASHYHVFLRGGPANRIRINYKFAASQLGCTSLQSTCSLKRRFYHGDYAWFVQAHDAKGNKGDSSDWKKFTLANNKLGKVTNLSPSGMLKNTLDVNLQWKPVEKASHYHVFLRGGPANRIRINYKFAASQLGCTSLQSTCSLKRRFYHGDYAWFVQAHDAKGNKGDSSGWKKFTLANNKLGKVTNLSPSGTLKNTLDVNLQWKPVEKASHYHVFLRGGPANRIRINYKFAASQLGCTSLQSTCSLKRKLYYGSYSWRVQAYDVQSNKSDPSKYQRLILRR